MAGEDAKALETLARYQTPKDFFKAHAELRGKLSERQAPARLADDATPEQVAAYRKDLGLPDIGKDAKGEDFLKAYKIEAPKDYQLSNVERGMLEDYAKSAYAAGHSPREVKASVDFFFKQQAANAQAINKIAVDKQKEWQNKLRDELGSKEYDAQQAAAMAWMQEQFKDQPEELGNILHAQLPGGGKVGDHPWLFKLITKAAMGDGYTDRIEANGFEANGKSLEDQQREIESLRRTDSRKYNDPAVQAKLDKIIELRIKRGEIDEYGNPLQQRRSA
jgi:hypothetical protein